jgi:parallel beta-helix repeat protein
VLTNKRFIIWIKTKSGKQMNIRLLLSFLAFPVIANSTTFYVATNGSNTVPYDTWAKASTSIQTAINAASNGDTIIVGSSDGHGSGLYNENLEVNKQLIIKSENGYNTTTVVASNSDDHVFEVTDNNATINGFSIYGATGIEKSAIYLDTVDDCIISNNRCGWDASYKNYRGIHLVSSNTCTISNTTASYNSGEGIYLVSSTEDTLTSNMASHNSGDGISLSTSSSSILNSNTADSNSYDGIRLVPSSDSNTLNNNISLGNGNNGFLLVASSNNNLTGNTANNNLATHGFYLVSSSNNNTLNNNTANSNMGNGIRLETSCSGNNLTSNTVSHNEFGIFLTDCSNNTISSNTMVSNDGRVDGDGIMLTGSSYNTIANNTMDSDPGNGIEFYEASNNDVIGNNVMGTGGWAIRINYYSSNNVFSNNTVTGRTKGIVLEEAHTVSNIIANNTTTNNTEDGIYLYDNTSNNTIICNIVSNSTAYGLHLNSSSNNTIYLNNLISNSTSNVLSENSSTNTWESPTTIYYDYNSGTLHKGYLGNYYSDGTHTGSNGIGGTYTIANDNNDDYQLIDTSGNYSLQAWWLNSDNNMYMDNVGKSGGNDTISNGGTKIWIADHATSTNIDFSGSDTWTGQLVFTSAPSNGHTFTIEIGSSTDGNDFTPGGPDATVTGDGSATNFTFTTDASAFIVSTGNYLAFRITSNDAEYTIRTGGAWSYISSPDNSTDYTIPVELSTFIANVSNGIVTLNWQTETEVNNYGFDVERASSSTTPAQEWQKIGFVEGHGNSTTPKEYSFIDNDLNGSYKLYYRLKQIDYDGTFEYSDIIEVVLGKITEYTLDQNYPNPFNPVTIIRYRIPSNANNEMLSVALKVYDILGNEIVALVNEEKQPGNYIVEFDGSNLSSGVYFYKLTAGDFSVTKKMVLLR